MFLTRSARRGGGAPGVVVACKGRNGRGRRRHIQRTGLEVLVEASVTCTSLVPSEETSLAGTDTTTAVSDQEVMWTPPAPVEVSEPNETDPWAAPEVLPVDGQGEGAGRR